MHGTRLTPDSCCAPMPRACFPWPSGATIPRFTGCRRKSAASSRWTAFHVPRRLARTVRAGRFTVTADRAFAEVMRACAAPAPGREESWINDEILRLYTALYAGGHAHSVECWRDGVLAGGLYGVQLGAAFFGESMFSPRARRQQGRAGPSGRGPERAAASPCWTPSSSPPIWRGSARWKSRAPTIWSCWTPLARDAVWPDF